MTRAIDLTNKRFGRLFVVARAGAKSGQATWHCWCDCGKESTVQGYNLRSGNTQSCGCLHREASSAIFSKLTLRHGMEGTPTYISWAHMRQRCSNPNGKAWEHYGGRGITVCAEWQASFEAFLRDMGERPDGTTIDRIDTNGNYEPGNCRWADATTQTRNRRKRVKA